MNYFRPNACGITIELTERGRKIITTKIQRIKVRDSRFGSMTGSGRAQGTDATQFKLRAMKRGALISFTQSANCHLKSGEPNGGIQRARMPRREKFVPAMKVRRRASLQ